MESGLPQIFCVKCRKKVTPTTVTAGVVTFTRKKTGAQGERYSLQALCPNCGINMKRFIKKDDASKYGKKEETTDVALPITPQ